jgi:hypothetical protein
MLILNCILGLTVGFMVLAMVGAPTLPKLALKRSERLERDLGYGRAAIVFAVALILAAPLGRQPQHRALGKCSGH